VSYLVFARKYRPQTFEEVVGQGHVARTLRNALETDRLAHAYLFCGPRGVGKTTMARILAKAVNCLVSPGPNPCGKCDACVGIAAGNDVDVIEIDAASNRGVGDVEPLVDATRYLPQRSPRKVFIVDETHMLSKHAWNALLKTLEEPPPHVLFIFATTEPSKVIETVRSRCQRFDFRRITTGDIGAKLQRIAEAEGAQVEPEIFSEIANRATGGMRDAETMLDQALSAAPADRALSVADLVAILGGIPHHLRRALIDGAAGGDVATVLDTAAEVVDAGADPVELLQDLYGDLHDAAVRGARGDDDSLGLEWCLAAAEIVARHQRLARESRSARATLDLALLSIARLGDVCDLEELAARLESVAAGAPPGPAPTAPQPGPATSPQKKVDLLGALKSKKTEPPGLVPPQGQPHNGGRAEPPAEARQADAGRRPREATVSGEELRRIRGMPLVRDVLDNFGGRIEQVRRNDDG
jgi:DNA polymerase-3 subunit gamma/tau